MEETITATCIAPINIAVIKYWGKRDDKLILPMNDSISGTLSTDQLCAKTTIAASPTYTETKYWLNGIEDDYKTNLRMKNVIEAMKELAKKKCTKNNALKYNLHICSINNFPTAAGLASSAAGYSCLVYTLAQLYGIENEDLTPIARVGSGSACRSLDGGFVHWIKGVSPTGEDSVAVQLCDENYWPELRVLIVVVNEGKKSVSSTNGMSLTCTTSELFNYRVMKCVPERIRAMKKAIAERNFKEFGELTMKDSNQFHAVCLDTYPPCVYMTDVSHRIAAIVHGYNKNAGETCVAYTFDAGPNVCIYLLEKEVRRFVTMLAGFFPCDAYNEGKFVRGIPIKYLSKISAEYKTNLGGSSYIERDKVKYIVHTKLGSGPKRLDDPEDCLLGADGLPKQNPKVHSSIDTGVCVPPCEPHEVPPEYVCMYQGVPWGPQWAEQWMAQWGYSATDINEKSFKLVQYQANRDNAEGVCNIFGPNSGTSVPTVASINSFNEQEFLRKYVYNSSDSNIWIGAKTQPNSNKFQSNDGSIFATNDGSNWARGSPTNELQTLSIKHLQQNILELKSVTNQLTTQMNEARVKSENSGQNAVPVGFVYVQLPRQQEPVDVWGYTMFWREITAEYAGLFFRAVGEGSESFGVTQDQDCLRLSGVTLQQFLRAATTDKITVPPSGWSTAVTAGAPGPGFGGTTWGIRFSHSTAEVRPRNTAVRIWIRVR